MSIIGAFIKRHPLLTYYTLTFAISWGGMLHVVGGPSGLPGTTDDKTYLLLQAIAAGLCGGFLEELGWTGFAIPRLRLGHVFATGNRHTSAPRSQRRRARLLTREIEPRL
jgi:membrane protease YdiL (CAAX protease family)